MIKMPGVLCGQPFYVRQPELRLGEMYLCLFNG